jgi:ATP-dependent Zn protease
MTHENPQPEQPASKSQSQIATAYHEAGHAVMAYLMSRPVEKVTICAANLQTGGFRLGACKMQKGRSKASSDVVEDEVLIMLAGMVAESHVTKRYCLDGAAQDLRAVRRLLANRAPNERQLERLAKRMLDKTEYLLSDDVNKTAVQLIAQELLEKETISGRAVRHLFEEAAKL